MTRKIVSKMTYVVWSGTLEPSIPYHTSHLLLTLHVQTTSSGLFYKCNFNGLHV